MVQNFYKDYDAKLTKTLATACFLTGKLWRRCLLTEWEKAWPSSRERAALDTAKRTSHAFITEKKIILPGRTREQKVALLQKISMTEFLTKHCKVAPEALPFFKKFPHDFMPLGRPISAYGCYLNGDDYGSFTYPGFDGLDLEEQGKEEPYIFHFPDGTHRSPAPRARPDSRSDARAHDGRRRRCQGGLQQAGSGKSARAHSFEATVLHAKQIHAADAKDEVEIAYARDGKLIC